MSDVSPDREEERSLSRKIFILILSLPLSFGTGVFADEIGLKNTDKLTGTLVNVVEGKLTLKVGYSEDTKKVIIDVAKIKKIETAKFVDAR